MVDESSLIDESKLPPYGYNRYNLEKFILENFDALIIRLPALFGLGLKKNIIFDLMNRKYLDSINTDSIYQFYNLKNLSNDIKIAINKKLTLLNMSTEPIKISEILNTCLDYNITSNIDSQKREENMLSKYGELWGNESNYLYSKTNVLEDLKHYMKSV